MIEQLLIGFAQGAGIAFGITLAFILACWAIKKLEKVLGDE